MVVVISYVGQIVYLTTKINGHRFVLKVSETLEELIFKIPKSVMEMTFIRLLGTIKSSFAESNEAQELLCIFLARSIVDGLISGSFIRNVNRVQIGGKLGVELISKTIKWIKYNKNHHRFKDQGSILVLNFPSETILNRRVKILALIIHFLRTGKASQFPKRLDEIDKKNIDIIFALKTLVRKFLSRDNGLVYKMVQIFGLLASNGQIGKTIVRIVINDITKGIHLIPGYGVHSERNLAKLRNALKEDGLF
ncbi:hypothetical protein MACK_002127 [Theileria orientalis]|uniref:MI domain-containing protein n=1 Tax=Theileria orientalis TaxID=68886 RepID=A0A976MDQ8_THEOR|nr:hypothetical protein MACK_002127 [Theileria orientalis]